MTNPSGLNPREVNELHRMSDKDDSKEAQHHTLGIGPYQSSPGDHNHDGRNSRILDANNHTHNTTSSNLYAANSAEVTCFTGNTTLVSGTLSAAPAGIYIIFAQLYQRTFAPGIVHAKMNGNTVGGVLGTHNTGASYHAYRYLQGFYEHSGGDLTASILVSIESGSALFGYVGDVRWASVVNARKVANG